MTERARRCREHLVAVVQEWAEGTTAEREEISGLIAELTQPGGARALTEQALEALEDGRD